MVASTSYNTIGSVTLGGVSFDGTEGEAGSAINWSSLVGDDTGSTLYDVEADGQLVDGIDEWAHFSITFTGYTVTGTDGTNYPVFFDGANYVIPLGVAGTSQTLIGAPGASNLYNSPESDVYFCFAAGTLITTPTGDRPVEALTIGSAVTGADGRVHAIKWIGRQTIKPMFGLSGRSKMVTIRANAFGSDMPNRDLTVTADHGMLVDGVLCNAAALVNGVSVTFVPHHQLPLCFTVYHIETEEHEIILANGAHAETFIDNVSRRAFDNFAEFEALFGDVPEMAELPYPRAMSARQVPDRIRTILQGDRAA